MHDLAWYLGCVENGLDFPGLPGSAGVGTHGGSEDHTAILACQTDHVSLFRFVPVTPLGDTRMPADWTFVIASSGVQADKADSVKDRYNRAVERRARAACDLEPRVGRAGAVAGRRAGQRPARRRCSSTNGSTATSVFSADDLRRRLRHFMRETARAPHAAAAFQERRSAGRSASWPRSRSARRTSCSATRFPRPSRSPTLAREIGAFASSSFGAGFGGSVWAAVPAADAQRFGDAWVRAYAAAHAARRHGGLVRRPARARRDGDLAL